MQPPPGMLLPSADIAPPPYEPLGHPMPQPGFVPPHMDANRVYMPAGFHPPPGPHPPMGYYPSGPYPPGLYPGLGGHTATVLVPSGAATTVTVLQGEIFEGAPVQTVYPHCQQAITTKISYEIGLVNFVLGLFSASCGVIWAAAGSPASSVISRMRRTSVPAAKPTSTHTSACVNGARLRLPLLSVWPHVLFSPCSVVTNP